MVRLKKNRFDYFLIWGHGQGYKDEIIELINKDENIDILRIQDYKAQNIRKLVKAIYSYDYAPFHHLKNKTKYLMSTNKKVTFIFVRNNFVNEIFKGIGSYMHIECNRIVKIKKNIRDLYNPKKDGISTEDHVIHASDNEEQVNYILNYLGVNQGIDIFRSTINYLNIPYHLKKIDVDNITVIKHVKISDLFANIIQEENGVVSTKIVPLHKTPQYDFVSGNVNAYKSYLNKYQGEYLKDYYSIKKFKTLLNTFNYYDSTDFILVESYMSSYKILDGVHRASILLHKYCERTSTDSIPVAILNKKK